MTEAADKHVCLLQVSTLSPLDVSKNSKPHQSTNSSKHRGMAAELADILSQLDDAARLADELDFGVKSSHRVSLQYQ